MRVMNIFHLIIIIYYFMSAQGHLGPASSSLEADVYLLAQARVTAVLPAVPQSQ